MENGIYGYKYFSYFKPTLKIEDDIIYYKGEKIEWNDVIGLVKIHRGKRQRFTFMPLPIHYSLLILRDGRKFKIKSNLRNKNNKATKFRLDPWTNEYKDMIKYIESKSTNRDPELEKSYPHYWDDWLITFFTIFISHWLLTDKELREKLINHPILGFLEAWHLDLLSVILICVGIFFFFRVLLKRRKFNQIMGSYTSNSS